MGLPTCFCPLWSPGLLDQVGFDTILTHKWKFPGCNSIIKYQKANKRNRLNTQWSIGTANIADGTTDEITERHQVKHEIGEGLKGRRQLLILILLMTFN